MYKPLLSSRCGDVQDDNGLVVHRRESAEEACAIDRKLQVMMHAHGMRIFCTLPE